MSLIPGARLGPHEIIAPLGAGGMGEVYRATDTNLNRAVAIKVLPGSVVGDVDRLARFRREAELLAALNHPNIAAVYGLERSEGTTALVMELVEGPTLADRIGKGPLPVDEALAIAKQIAEALEAAHEQGIIHRDLKPANVKVRDDGTVKVLDFGLAKALEPAGAASSPESTHSPTLTSPALSQTGVILGTAAYMSPEQARAKPVDRRADVWAFGAVLYEMLTGRRAFPGEDMTDTLAAVVRTEPAWEDLPRALSPSLKTILSRCLEKDPKQRLHDIADVRLLMEGAFERLTSGPGAAPARWNRTHAFILAASIAAALAAGVMLERGWLSVPRAESSVGVTRFSVDLPPGQRLWGGHALEGHHLARQRPSRRSFALSPDGRSLVYAATDGSTSRLYRRPLDRMEATPIPGTEGAFRPLFSPDGRAVAFAVGSDLKRVSMETGEVRTLTMSGATLESWDAGSWTERDTLLLASAGHIYELPANGGRLSRLTHSDASQGDTLAFPELLPGGQALLFNVAGIASPSEWPIAVESLDTGQRHVVIEGGSDPRYVPSGHVLFLRSGTLMAVPFDAARLEVTGSPIAVVEDVMHAAGTRLEPLPKGAGQVSVTHSGALAYVPGGIAPEILTSLAWVDHTGAWRPLPLPMGGQFLHPRFSPDGTRLAYSQGSHADLDLHTWVYDIGLSTPVRLLTGKGWDSVWSPDGTRLAFTSLSEDPPQLFWMPSDGSGAPQRLTDGVGELKLASSWSPDGVLVFVEGDDIWTVSTNGDTPPEPFLETPFREWWPALSPDGRWLAYASNETGRFEVYVRPFPADGPAHRVSTAGGSSPLWAPDGRQLFFRTFSEDLTPLEVKVVDVTTQSEFVRGQPRTLFGLPPTALESAGVSSYDISPDGEQFVMVQSSSEIEAQPVSRINIVLSWFEELNGLVPVD